MPQRLKGCICFAVFFLSTAHFLSFANLLCNTDQAFDLYKRPIYTFKNEKNGFDKINIHIKNESVIMLCYIHDRALMMVYWNTGLTFEKASEILNQSGQDWEEISPEAYENQVIKTHKDEPNFRLTPYRRQIKVWRDFSGNMAFFDSYKRELKIQSEELGVKKRETPNEEFFLKLTSTPDSPPSPSPKSADESKPAAESEPVQTDSPKQP